MTETDPNGIDTHASGAKLDDGKPRMSMVLKQFPLALRAVTIVGMDGAKKYSWGGWRQVKDGIERYGNALLRHVLPDDGNYCSKSKTLHAAHEAWNALATLEKILEEGIPLKCKPLVSTQKPQVLNLEEVPNLFTSAPVVTQEKSKAGDSESIHSPERYESRIKLDERSESISETAR